MSYYGNYAFFEQRMQEHSKVMGCDKISPSLYLITLASGAKIKVFICECYAFGAAEYLEVCENFDNVNAVVISSNWCGYSIELKRDCMVNEVGIFDIGGFMAAINKPKFWAYLNSYEKDRFKEYGWL